MRFGAYVVLLFSISLVLYFMGYTSVVSQYGSLSGLNTSTNSTSNLVGITCDSGKLPTGGGNQTAIDYVQAQKDCPSNQFVFGALFFVLIGAAAIIVFVSGFSAIYIVPLLILMAIMQFFVMPMSFILDASIPVEIRVALIVFFNMLTVLASIHFIRGQV